jgi:lipopolysaccharide heptosyltransferase II
MFDSLHIADRRERLMVGVADLVLAPLGWVRRRRRTAAPQRILLLRLERIGDLLMTLEAIRDVRTYWPDAQIDIAVGSWNAPLARLLTDVNRVEIVDVPWLAREDNAPSWPALMAQARRWRARRYDLVLNFEPDIRSNLLAWLSGAAARVGYSSGGGRALLTDARGYEPIEHVALNARRLAARAAGRTPPGAPDNLDLWPRLMPPPDAVDRARTVLGTNRRPLVGMHVSGGRQSKQWHVDRFAATARQLARDHSATIVLTGAPADRALVDLARSALRDVPFVDASGALDLPTLAALLAELDLLVTSDTGPMHLAAAMGTPVVALFGPSDPRRYGPLVVASRVLRVDLWCSPCGRVRLPPARCRGHVPDCMDGISVEAVVSAAAELLTIQR